MVGRHGFALVQRLVAQQRWRATKHARASRDKFQWDARDVAACIARGEVISQGPDAQAVDGLTYEIRGPDRCGCGFYLVGKVIPGEGGEPVFLVCTAHPDGEW